MGRYVVSTPQEQQEMLHELGLTQPKELYSTVPASLLLDKVALPAGKSELEVRAEMESLARQNHVFSSCFRGAGAYRHYIPAIVKQVVTKEEFVTAYTPYQAEMSQGILQSIFEYQTMICELTQMEVSNASVYDGATAAAEAIVMCQTRKRSRALVSSACHPDTLAVIRTYCHAANIPVAWIPLQDGKTDFTALNAMLGDDVACVLFQQPNYFGLLEDAQAIVEAAHQAGALAAISCNPIAAALLPPPGESGADIAVGEGQPLGLPLAFGGPYLGFMAAKEALLRRLPGRIVGETVDSEGNRAFVLTLQAREQHIKREKASSSICSNQALCAMTAAVYLAAMGPNGLRDAAVQCYAKAHYLAARLAEIPGFSRCHGGDFFHEFATHCPIDPQALSDRLAKKEMLGGLPLPDGSVLWCVTELNSRAEIDRLLSLVKEVTAV